MNIDVQGKRWKRRVSYSNATQHARCKWHLQGMCRRRIFCRSIVMTGPCTDTDCLILSRPYSLSADLYLPRWASRTFTSSNEQPWQSRGPENKNLHAQQHSETLIRNSNSPIITWLDLTMAVDNNQTWKLMLLIDIDSSNF